MTEKRRRKTPVKIQFNEAWAAARLNHDRLTLAELAAEIGISTGQLHKRLTDAGWRTGWVHKPEWRRQ